MFVSPTSELVRLPDWPAPAASTSRSACPHLQAGLADWDHAATWPSGRVPEAGESVALPSNTRVLLSSNTRVLGVVSSPIITITCRPPP